MPPQTIYQTTCQSKPIKFFIKLYPDYNNLWVKHATHQKAESLRAGSLWQHGQKQLYIQYKVCWILCKMVGGSSFPQPYLWIQTLLQSPPRIRSSNSVSFRILIPPLLVYKIILSNPTNTLFLCIAAIFTFLFSRRTIPRIYTKNISPISAIKPIQATSRDQGTREFYEDWHKFNLSRLPQSKDSDNRAHNHWFPVTHVQKNVVL